MPERGFLTFWSFLVFFWNFLVCVEYERNSGVKFFSRVLGLSHLVLAENNAGKRFFNFSNFFSIFLQFSSLSRVWTEFGTKFFFFSFSSYLIPFWQKLISERGFLKFSIFLQFFWEFSCPGWVWTDFWTKIFFSPFRPISSRFD